MMGNEMGNNNASGMREEDNKIPVPEQTVHVNDLEAENRVVLATKTKDYNKKETGIASDDPTHTLNGAEKVPVESPEAEQKLSEESEFQSTEELADSDYPNSSKLEDRALEISKLQIENLSSSNKEERSVLSTTFAYDAESEDFAEQKSDQHESKEAEADQLSEQESSNSARGVKDTGGLSDIPSNSKENGHALDARMSGYLEGTVSPNANSIEEKTDGEIPRKMNSNGSNYLEQEKTDMSNHLVCSDVDPSVPEDKCIILTEESESTANKQDDNESESEIDRENASETDSSIMPNCKSHGKEDPLITSHEATSNGNYQVEEVKLDDESEEQCEGSEEEITMIHEVGMLANSRMPNCNNHEREDPLITSHEAASNGNCQVEEVKLDDESEEQCEGSEEEITMIHEVGMLANSIMPNCNNHEREDPLITSHEAASNGNCQVEEMKLDDESEEQCEGSEEEITMIHEVGMLAKSRMPNCNNHEKEDPLITSHEATSNGNCQVEEVKLADESEEQCEGSEEEITMIHEVEMLANGQNSKDEMGDDESESHTFEESDDQDKVSEGKIMTGHGHEWFAAEPSISNEKESRDCKPEAYEAELPITNGTINKEESEVYKAKEEEPVNKQSLAIKEKKEAPCHTKKDTDERKNGNEFISQELPVAAEDHKGSSESNPEVKLESRSEFLATKAINFPATSIVVEKLISAVDLPIKKPEEEVSAHVTAAPEMVTTSENHSSEQKSIFENDSCDGIREELQKSPNFTTESTLSAVEKAQQEVPYYKTEVIETVKLSGSVNQSSEERISTESIPEYLNAGAEMRKSPSFDIDLRRSEESDQAPLLYQNMENISLQTSLLAVENNEDMPAEEKVITLERSDSEKSRTAFLGLKKEEEEAHPPKKEDKHEPAKKATKSKEKHKRRPSVFTNCMCCTTAIH